MSDDARLASSEKEDEDLTIPRAAMNKLIKELLPDIRVANDTRELILQCCSEFIRLITTQANVICEEQQKKTMSAEHVLVALDKLGLSSYKSEAEAVVQDNKGKRRRQSTRLEHLGIPEEVLLQQQQELFAKAKAEQQQVEQKEWLEMQNAAMAQEQQFAATSKGPSDDDDEY